LVRQLAGRNENRPFSVEEAMGHGRYIPLWFNWVEARMVSAAVLPLLDTAAS
jgi:hypothetical protein